MLFTQLLLVKNIYCLYLPGVFMEPLSAWPVVTGSATVTIATTATAVTNCAPVMVSATRRDVSVSLAGPVTTVRRSAVQACLSAALDTGTVAPTSNVSAMKAGLTRTVTGQYVHMPVTVVAIVPPRVTR